MKYQVDVSIMGQFYIEANSLKEAEDIAHERLGRWTCEDEDELIDADCEVLVRTD